MSHARYTLLQPRVSIPDDYSDEHNYILSKKSKTSDQTPARSESSAVGVVDNITVSEATVSSGTIQTDQLARLPVSHISVPVTEIFARNAPPLSLPALDKYLERQPAPAFPSQLRDGIYHAHVDDRVAMFPPMDRLVSSKKSLQDLEHNNVVQPGWKNRTSIFGSLVNIALAITGSSAVAKFYSLHGLIDTVQIFALLLNSITRPTDDTLQSGWRKLIFGTIPNVLALNFSASLAYLLAFMAAATLLLLYFWRVTQKCRPEDEKEGLQRAVSFKRSWRLIFVCFILSIIYLPLSTIAVHALVWSNDFWVTHDGDTTPSGNPNELRDPSDVCYTTTMSRNEINLAPLVFGTSAITFTFLTVWFPMRLRKTVQQAIPSVDKYTELGRLRSKSEMDREYQRLLDRDRQPLAFLYQDFRRGWGTYKAFYLFAKLSALLIVSVFNPENCLFRSLPKARMAIAREAILVAAMLGFFLLQCLIAPFVHPVDNASEWISRINYLLTAMIGLAVATNAPGGHILKGPILMIVYISTYGLSAYFTLINFSWMHRVIKRLTGRVDFSVDVFSPRLDVSAHSVHIVRRIWQEALSTLLLTSPECKIPSEQMIQFVSSRTASHPPYLLDFMGSPSERHVENLKILREVGLKHYVEGLSVTTEAAESHNHHMLEQLQKYYIGPDSYWKDPFPESSNERTYFGNSWWLPFPPTLVIRYDDGRLATLSSIRQFLQYVEQNNALEIRRKRDLRMAMRALNGRTVYWPYEHKTPSRRFFNFQSCGCLRRKLKAHQVTKFCTAAFKVKQRGDLIYGGIQLSSGFEVELVYSKHVCVNGDSIGLSQDFIISPTLAQFLAHNKSTIRRQLPILQTTLQSYRDHLWHQCRAKADVLSYRFLISIYNEPTSYPRLIQSVEQQESDSRVRRLFTEDERSLRITYERFKIVSSSSASIWWYIFWDDLWRRNHSTFSGLSTHESDFNPYFPTSIAYQILPRVVLEQFLTQRGLFSSKAGRTELFHSGFLNKIYLRLNEVVFHGTPKALAFHVGEGKSEIDMDEIDLLTHARSSTLGTGGGTDHDDSSIRVRPNYRWEGLFEDTMNADKNRVHRWIAKLGLWFGVTPHWRKGTTSQGLAIDVVLDHGRYHMLHRDAK